MATGLLCEQLTTVFFLTFEY